MPTVRRPLKHGAVPRITDEAVRLFERVLEIRKIGRWEVNEVLHREHYWLWGEFDRVLDIKPFEHNPLSVPSTGPMPAGLRDTWKSWKRAQLLRRELLRAVREQKRAAQGA